MYSNNYFNILIENKNVEDRGYELIKYGLNKTSEKMTEYILSIKVPLEIVHDFESDIVLVQSVTGQRTVIPVTFFSKPSQSKPPVNQGRVQRDDRSEIPNQAGRSSN